MDQTESTVDPKAEGLDDLNPASYQWPISIKAANVNPARDGNSFDVYPVPRGCCPTFPVKTIHLSCKSSAYRGEKHKYGGIVIYGRNGQCDWHINNTHCKSGYVVIMQTDTSEFDKQNNEWDEPGKVHGTIYRIAFDESCKDVEVVGEGFGIIYGEFMTSSGAFNPSDDNYHNDSALMHKDSARYIKSLVNVWKSVGPNFPDKQNYSVKELGD